MKAVFLTTVLAVLLIMSSPAEGYQTFSIGGRFGYATLLGGGAPWFAVEPTYGLRMDTHLGGKWSLELSLSRFAIHDDTTFHSEFAMGSNEEHRLRTWKGYDITLLSHYRLFPHSSRFTLTGGFGGGMSFWEMLDAKTNTVLYRPGERGELMEFSAAEIFLTMATGAEYRLASHWKINIDLNANYLTGLGLEFVDSVESSRGRWNMKIGLVFSYFFWKPGWESRWEKDEPVFVGRTAPVNIPKNIEIDELEKILKADNDRDGIPDIDDECSETPEAARGLVDIRGCPIDTDFDGIADYLDRCPQNRIGARIDESGCPLDGDKDGVPDGLDDCPDSENDLAVDQSGCIDLSILEEPMILYIKYHSGSFEIDRKTKKKLDDLSRILLRAPGVRVEINGYTDNIGAAEANRSLSEKRARRVRDYLVGLGINSDSVTPIGRGETNFLASNNTKAGRQKNRRVELIFFK
jgi:outer membrane protein OmpA-like peptidoglycan-associated protein